MKHSNYQTWISEYLKGRDLDHEQEVFYWGIMEEFGEVCGKFKRVIRGDKPSPTNESICKELMDLYWYVNAFIICCKNSYSHENSFTSPVKIGEKDIKKNMISLKKNLDELLNKNFSKFYYRFFNYDIINLLNYFGMSFEDALQMNYDKIIQRQKKGTIRGQGDIR